MICSIAAEIRCRREYLPASRMKSAMPAHDRFALAPANAIFINVLKEVMGPIHTRGFLGSQTFTLAEFVLTLSIVLSQYIPYGN
jgi:hypothetical protein